MLELILLMGFRGRQMGNAEEEMSRDVVLPRVVVLLK